MKGTSSSICCSLLLLVVVGGSGACDQRVDTPVVPVAVSTTKDSNDSQPANAPPSDAGANFKQIVGAIELDLAEFFREHNSKNISRYRSNKVEYDARKTDSLVRPVIGTAIIRYEYSPYHYSPEDFYELVDTLTFELHAGRWSTPTVVREVRYFQNAKPVEGNRELGSSYGVPLEVYAKSITK